MREEIIKKFCSKFANGAEKNFEKNPETYSPVLFAYEIELGEKNNLIKKTLRNFT